MRQYFEGDFRGDEVQSLTVMFNNY